VAKARVFITSDAQMMTGVNNIDGDKDDIQSLVHAFMYQDKINIVGISSSTSQHQPGKNDEKFINLTIDEYAKDYANLAAKASGFKTASQLKSITYQGTKKLADSSGAPPATEGSNALIKEAKAAKAAGEPLYVATWGGMGDVARALKDAPEIAGTIRLLSVYGQGQESNAYKYIKDNFAGKNGFWWIDQVTTFKGVYAGETSKTPAVTLNQIKEFADGHGALGTLFYKNSQDLRGTGDTYSGLKMGDSGTILYLIDNADNNNPTAESWGGEYRQIGTNTWTDKMGDSLNFSSSNGARTIYEDRAAWLGDFKARFDWLKDGSSNPTPQPTPDPAPTPTPPPASTTPTGTNLLKNGSFENASVATGQYKSFTSIPDWKAIAGGTIELWNAHNGVAAIDGKNLAELDFGSGLDGFEQSVQTKAGVEYTFTLDAMVRSGKSVSTAHIEVVWNGKVITTFKPGTTWNDHSVKVTGTGGTDKLTVREVASQSKDGHGALIDNFRLIESGAKPVTPSPTEPVPAPTPSTGEDTITVKISGTDYKGDPNFAFLVDGKVIDSTNLVTADHKEGEWQTFTFKGDFDRLAGDQKHKVGIQFTNNLSGAAGDRNLYVDEITFNGENNTTNQSITWNTAKYWDFVL
jgi:hypothetical protein